MFLGYIFILPLGLILGTILLTVLFEFPIIYATRVTRNKRYIVAVNALTNVCLNAGIVAVFLININGTNMVIEKRIEIFTFFAEAILIPVAETILYLKVSKKSAIKVLLITYLANFVSFLAGLFVVGLFTGRGVYGISYFFAILFGGGGIKPWLYM